MEEDRLVREGSGRDLACNMGGCDMFIFIKHISQLLGIFARKDDESQQNPSIITTGNDQVLRTKENRRIEPKRLKGKVEITKNDISIIQVVGRGTWGTVVACSLKGNRRSSSNDDEFQLSGQSIEDLSAVKIMKKEDLQKDNMIRSAIIERQVLEVLDHPLLVKLHFAFQDETKLFMGMDYVPGGDLFYHLKRFGAFNEHYVQFYAAELSLALQYLHELGIVYRDVKPENVILDADGHIKLVDFGLAKLGVTSPFVGANSTCGTSYYMAPEVIRGKSEYGTAVDWWGLGVLLFELLTGNPPWYEREQSQKILFFKIQRTALPCPVFFTPDCRSLLFGLLEKDPNRRLGSQNKAYDVLNHPFFNGLEWEDVENGRTRPPIVPCPNCASQTASKFNRRKNNFRWNIFKSLPTWKKTANDQTLETFDFEYCSLEFTEKMLTQKLFDEQMPKEEIPGR